MASSILTAKPSLFSSRQISSSPSLLSIPSRHIFSLPQKSSFAVAALAQKFEPSKVLPQADRVLIRLEPLPEKTAGGVLLPKSAVKFERYLMGEVLSIGSDVSEVEAGKKVLFSDINAYEVDLGTDDKHCFCRASELLAVVE